MTGQELVSIVLRHRRELDALSARSESEVARVVARVEAAILRAVSRASGPVSAESIADVTRFARRVVLASERELRKMSWRDALRVYAESLAQSREVARASFGARVLRSVERVYDAFERDIESKVILRSARPYVEVWSRKWNQQWSLVATELQAQFVRAQATGQPWSDLAASISDDLGRLRIGGRIDNEAFARAFARTRLAELASDANVAISRRAGLELFISVGVPDERQSEICYEASLQPAMSLREWDESRFGRPPRHVMNCRCTLVGVTEDVEGRANNPKFELAEVGA